MTDKTHAVAFAAARASMDRAFGIGVEQAHEILRMDAGAKRIYDCALQALCQLPDDVRDLVIATREVLDEYGREGVDEDPWDTLRALDQAAEAFSSRVPYENEPDEAAPFLPGLAARQDRIAQAMYDAPQNVAKRAREGG